jgi:hypothetical protein
MVSHPRVLTQRTPVLRSGRRLFLLRAFFRCGLLGTAFGSGLLGAAFLCSWHKCASPFL